MTVIMNDSVGAQLRAFRKQCGISIREAARQLQIVYPALIDWEKGRQTPSPPYRHAIEVWTSGAILATDWPLSDREREVLAKTALVLPARHDQTRIDFMPNQPCIANAMNGAMSSAINGDSDSQHAASAR
jgi:transcriptional regulator with XRE-family HTH domain